MSDIPLLVDSLVNLLWPLMVVYVIVRFGPAVQGIIESAKSRAFSLKVGGQELSMEEASQQQRDLIADLQAQVIGLQEAIEGGGGASRGFERAGRGDDDEVGGGRDDRDGGSRGDESSFRKASTAERAILWVDDEPKSNSFMIEQLKEKGVKVDLATSTDEGLRLFQNGYYRIIVSDLGRNEGGKYQQDAGLTLLRAIRDQDRDIPFVIFASARATREYGDEARKLGATDVTSSATQMARLFSEAVEG